MIPSAALAAVLLALVSPGLVAAKGHGGSRHATSHATKHHSTPSPSTVRRNAHGKIARDPRSKASFRRSHPCPSTGRTSGACPGYEVDHVRPLACGGADAPGNMQWLSRAANRSKGSEGCRR